MKGFYSIKNSMMPEKQNIYWYSMYLNFGIEGFCWDPEAFGKK